MSEYNEVLIGGKNYRLARLDTFSQIHCVRRMGPTLIGTIPAVMAWLDTSESTPEEKKMEVLKELLAGIPSMLTAFAAMSDEDVDYVIHKCLNVAYLQQGQMWSQVRKGGAMMFDDIDLPTIGQIVFQVLKESLGGFFPTELPKGFAAAAPPSS